jgi:ATP-dependent DNA ligase
MSRAASLDLAVPTGLEPMEARLVDALPDGPGWQFEPKWDGFRCLAFRQGSNVELRAKSGKPLTRFFPEVVRGLRTLKPARFVLDGELLIATGDGFSFDALQMRLHPAASRIERLSRETPATFMAFDCLLDRAGRSLLEKPFCERSAALADLMRSAGDSDDLQLTPSTRRRATAERWLKGGKAYLDGVVAKRLDLPYLPGERAMLKVKRRKTADCVVGGFRYETKGHLVGSLLLGLYDADGLLHHVGYTSSLSAEEKPALTRKLEKLVKPPGFTGDAPGGPSRWSTQRTAEWQPLAPKLVVEVRYDHVTADRFRHGTKLVRWRPDKSPRQCTFEQLRTP